MTRDLLDGTAADDGLRGLIDDDVASGLGRAADLFAALRVIEGTPGPDDLTGTAEADTIIGFRGDDTIAGLAGNDTLSGRRGEDRIDGGDGSDEIAGGKGADTILGGDGDDTGLFGNGGADVIRGGPGDDILFGGKGADELFGGAGSDSLFGQQGADVLDGRRGSDFLRAGLGQDEMTGGRGQDFFTFTFMFGDPSEELDSILDFNQGEADTIAIFNQVFDEAPTADDVADFVRIQSRGDDAVVQVDQDGGVNSFADLAIVTGGADLDFSVAVGDLGVLIS